MRHAKTSVLLLALLSACDGKPPRVAFSEGVAPGQPGQAPTTGTGPDEGKSLDPSMAMGAAQRLELPGDDDEIEPPTYHIVRGNVDGLHASGLVLANGDDSLAIEADGAFSFATPVATGSPYAVSVSAQPSASHRCDVTNAAGFVAGADVTDVTVHCYDVSYTVGGTITGLPSGAVLRLSDELEELSLSDNGSFTFPIAMEDQVFYLLHIVEQPVGALCTLNSIQGFIDGANITDVEITCVATSCANRGWKRGDGDWSCPAGYRMPTPSDWANVTPCITNQDAVNLDQYGGVATSVGGCGCDWNADYCDVPTVEVIGGLRMCGDYEQLHVCVAE